MPKVNLRPHFVQNPTLPTDKAKVDYFDSQLAGFMLEVRSSGKSTYYLRYRDKLEKLKQVKIGTPETMSLDEARSRARALKSQTIIGFDPREELARLKAIPTFKDFIYGKYLPYVKTYKRSWEQDQKFIEQRMLKLWGSKRLNEITTDNLVDFQGRLVLGGFKPGTVNRIMALVRYVFNLAERWDIIDKAPTRNISMLQDNGRKERFLSEDEMESLFEALEKCNSTVVPDIIEFLLLTGARKSEVVELPWAEVDMEKGVWVLPAERNKGKREKVIPLSENALAVLKRRAGNGSDWVFPNPKTGVPLQHFFSTWDRIRKLAGLPDVRIHDLRHTFASYLINNKRSLYEVQKLLGHSQLSTTQRYSHLSEGTLKEAAEIAGGMVGIRKVKN